MVREVEREPAVSKDREDRLDVGEDRRAGRATLLEDPACPRVAEHHLSGRHHLPADRRLPVLARLWTLDLADNDLDDAVEQVVLVPDVAVERHGLDAQLLPEPAHAQPLEAVTVRELDGGKEHALPGQR